MPANPHIALAVMAFAVSIGSNAAQESIRCALLHYKAAPRCNQDIHQNLTHLLVVPRVQTSDRTSVSKILWLDVLDKRSL